MRSERWSFREYFEMSRKMNIEPWNCKHQKLYPHLDHIIPSLVLVKTGTRIGHQITLVSEEFMLASLAFHPTLASVFWPYEDLLESLQMLEGFCPCISIACSSSSTPQNPWGCLHIYGCEHPLFGNHASFGTCCFCTWCNVFCGSYMPFDFHFFCWWMRTNRDCFSRRFSDPFSSRSYVAGR